MSLRSTSSLALILFCVGCSSAPPRADLSEALVGGGGPVLGATGGLVPDGYEVHEYVAEGVATEYLETEAGLPDDGRWTLARGSSASYRTRVIVRRPSDPKVASGTVLVEWLNVSGGLDADADYMSLVEEIVRQGHVWVGVSAQRIGVEGGQVLVSTGLPNDLAGRGLKAIDPERYGSLSHPGDGYAFDLFTQVGRALRDGSPVLGGIRPDVLIAVGESQSAMALTTYYDGFHAEARVYDGFLVHSRGAFPLPIVGPGEAADLLSALTRPERPRFRDDLSTPVLTIQAEGDTVGILASSRARQDDGPTFRLWEVAGTAHADRHLLGPAADLVDCTVPINDGPMHLVTKAALRALDVWIRTGEAPPSAPRIDVDLSEGAPRIVRDADGVALGGIRTPPVDVPVDVLSGQPASTAIFCLLLGTTTPLPDERIAALYASRDAYVSAFAASADAAIAAGFVLLEDREALLGYAEPDRVAP